MEETSPVLKPSLIGALRTHTVALHEDAERAMDIMSARMTPAIYASKLARMHSLFSEIQNASDAVGAPENVRTQIARLETDLKFLRSEIPFAGGSQMRANFVTQLANADFRAGVFYVIEGSSLGGQVVSRHLQTTMDITPTTGGSFFYGEGPQTRERWQQTLGRLARLDTEPDRWEKVLHGAEQTFLAFAQVFRLT